MPPIMSREESNKPVFLTRNESMESLIKNIKQVAQKGCTTLQISGENGTGKEVIARLFHYFSPRKDKPMVTINCGAIPTDLVESELFGHEKGAFTGAHERKEGCFEQADGGILFLDEIGEMPKSMQVKLLRAVELGSLRRVGGSKEIQVDIILVSATNKILADEVASGDFRQDLFYRLNAIEFYVPPLRHRKEDIPLLVNYYQNHFLNLYGKEAVPFSNESIEMMVDHDWPGNVRELKNVVERSVVLLSDRAESDLDQTRLKVSFKEDSYASKNRNAVNTIIEILIGTSLEKVEQQVINQTLNFVDNNKTEAAKILGFSRKTLYNKLDTYRGNKEM